jgi:hypothetical protein
MIGLVSRCSVENHKHPESGYVTGIRVGIYIRGTGLAQSVLRLAIGWTVRGWNPGGGEIFRTRPDRPWGPPSLYNGYRVTFQGVKRPGRGVDHPPHLAPRLKEEYIYTSSPPLVLRGLF